jgi:hypothetical protein
MIINLSPIFSSPEMIVSVEGDIIYIDGVEYDFSPLPEGARLPAEHIESPHFEDNSVVTRINGEIVLTLWFRHSATAPEESLFPVPIHVTEDGSVDLPPFETPLEEPEVPNFVPPEPEPEPEEPINE